MKEDNGKLRPNLGLFTLFRPTFCGPLWVEVIRRFSFIYKRKNYYYTR